MNCLSAKLKSAGVTCENTYREVHCICQGLGPSNPLRLPGVHKVNFSEQLQMRPLFATKELPRTT